MKKKLIIGGIGLSLPAGFLVFLMIFAMFSGVSSSDIKTTSSGCSISGSYDAAHVDSVLKKAGAFAGQRQAFENVAKENNIDPIIMIAICIHETGWGQSVAVLEYNNPSGQMGSNGLIKFDTLEEGLQMTGRTLDNLMNERGLDTIEKLQTAYAPSGAANDPTGLNNFWVKNVQDFVNQLGGVSEGASCSTNTGDATGNAKKVLDWAYSLHKKGVIYTMDGRRGNFPYYDCSAFVTLAMKDAGYQIGLGSTETLYSVEGSLLEPISREEAKAGDIFVWGVKGGSGGQYGHTGIFVDNKTIIHCTPATDRGFGQEGDIVVTPFEGYYGSSALAPVYFYRLK